MTDRVIVTARVDRGDPDAVDTLVRGVIASFVPGEQPDWPVIAGQKLSAVYNLTGPSQVRKLVREIEKTTRAGLVGEPAFRQLKMPPNAAKAEVKLGTLVQTLANKLGENVRRDESK